MNDAAAMSPGPPPGGGQDPTPGIPLLVAATILHAGAGSVLGSLLAGISPREVGGMLAATQFMFAGLAGAIAYRMWEGEGGGIAAVALGAIGFAFIAVAGGILFGLMVGAAPAALEIIGGALVISNTRSTEGAPTRIPAYWSVPTTRRPPPAR